MGDDVVYYVSRRSLLVWGGLIGVVYLVLTRIDLIVHYELYRYGLVFSSAWAEPYWHSLTLCFWALAAVSAASYWLESRSKNPYLVVLIVLTILVPYHVGFEDVLWFVWRGGFPAEGVAWTWHLLNDLFPPWTTARHLAFCAAGMLGLAACWAFFIAKKWVRFRVAALAG